MVTELGAHNVSSALLVEAWKAKGRACDERFFMHFDVLLNYQFLTQASDEEQLLDFEQLMELTAERDRLVSITDAGREFFERYGG